MIINLKTNYQKNPIGIDLSNVVFSWQSDEIFSNEEFVISKDRFLKNICFSTNVCHKNGISFSPDFEFEDGVKYYWKIKDSEVACFEGGHPKGDWNGKWITSDFDHSISPVFIRHFHIDDIPSSARLYICALGLYEVIINGKKVGDQYLTPYFTDYRFWIQYQTYDIESYLVPGENTITVLLGEGWYKGRLGFDNPKYSINHFGDSFKMLCDLYLYDKAVTIISSDDNWYVKKSPIVFSNIYDGEIWDERIYSKIDNIEVDSSKAIITDAPQGKLSAMIGLPVIKHEVLKPTKLITSCIDETILDFGQEITGWVCFKADAPKGTEIKLYYSEIMQDDKFYRDNLRSAQAEYTYISDGNVKWVRPHFTFYGFRYVKIEGISVTDNNVNDFEAWAIYSDLAETGNIETSNPKLNRLILNTKWSQKDNFLDIPTDCPQRDERLGWTGDAQIFSNAASYHMETPTFYRKYLKDMFFEQQITEGAVPYVVPDILSIERMKKKKDKPSFNIDVWGEAGSCAWGDAATVIPWTMYVHYGNKKWLREEYNNMKAWVNFIQKMDENYCNGKRLWNCGFHFGDWLSLDAENNNLQGGTDKYYIASIYYMYSAMLTSKAAKVLEIEADTLKYEQLSNEVRASIRKEYLLPNGKLKCDTQTAYAVGIEFDLFDENEKKYAGEQLKSLLDKNNGKLATGFVGTAFLLDALVHTGHNQEAYNLLLNEEYPGWLYEVNLGATTIWERWNSVLANGKISDTGMNSLNHYAYGCVVAWMYRWICGFEFDEEMPAGQIMHIHPLLDIPITYSNGYVNTIVGRYICSWEKKDSMVSMKISVPVCGLGMLEINGDKKTLTAGEYHFNFDLSY